MEKNNDILEKLVHINRITKVVKGGRRFGFSALVVVGNQNGKIGIAHAKAKQVPDAIKKANELAKRKLVQISLNLLVNHSTIPLRFFSYIGLTISIVSFSIGLGFMIKQLVSGLAPPGWTSLIVLVSFYNALILIIFFILGIYISRLLKESASHKQYSIRRIWK